MNLPKSCLDFLATASHEMKILMYDTLGKNIEESVPQIKDFVDFVPDFSIDKDFHQDLKNELETTPFEPGPLSTKWLSPKEDSYFYTDKDDEHKAIDINSYPGVNKLMGKMNNDERVDGPMEATLALKYSSNAATLRKHSDDEPLIDQAKSICCFSLGSERTIDYYNKRGRTKRVASFRLTEGSLLVMKPGCQQHFYHSIRSEPRRSGTTQPRYSLSSRGLSNLPNSPNKSDSLPVSPKTISPAKLAPTPSGPPSFSPVVASSEDPLPSAPSKTCRKVILIAGDSFAERLDSIRLSKRRYKGRVFNIAKGGAKIADVETAVEKYVLDNPDDKVEKVIMSIGTNDIRYCSKGVSHLKGPLKKLFKKVKTLAPDAKVFVQSLLPLPFSDRDRYKISQNVNAFNNILYNCCSYEHIYYMDVFDHFLNEWGSARSRELFPTSLSDVHPNSRGMGKLAKFYIYVIHNRRFNPVGF